jgi:hypothetical protein
MANINIENKEIPTSPSDIYPHEKETAIDLPVKETGQHADIAFDLFQQSRQYDNGQLKIDAVKVRRKLDIIVLPMMMMTYMLSFLDKQTYFNNFYSLIATHG